MSEVKQLALMVVDFSDESKEELNVLKNDVVTFIKDEGDVKRTFVLKISGLRIVPTSFCKLLPKGLTSPQVVDKMRENVKAGNTPPKKPKSGSVHAQAQITHNVGTPK
eukprot:gene13261-11183_t